EFESCSSIVRTAPTGWSLSTCQTAARSAPASAAGEASVFITNVMNGNASCRYGTKTVGAGALSSDAECTSAATATTGYSRPGTLIWKCAPIGSRPGQ